MIWLYVILAGVLTLTAAGTRALILAATRPGPGRRELREQAGEREADDFIGALRPLPAQGKDIYSDRDVWLPRTPTEAELDELQERWTAAQRNPKPPIILPPPATFEPAQDWDEDMRPALAERLASMEEARRLDDTPRPVLPGCSCGSYAHWQGQHDDAAPKLLDSRPEPVTHPDPPEAAEDSTFVKALLALPVERVAEAFDGARP